MIVFSYHEDFENLGCLCVDGNSANVYAVGWLGDGKGFSQGAVSHDFICRLRELIDNSMASVRILRGYSSCALCGYNGMTCNSEPRMGGSVILIPIERNYFLSPDLIFHYIQEHHYIPPRQFIEQVNLFTASREYDASRLLKILKMH